MCRAGSSRAHEAAGTVEVDQEADRPEAAHSTAGPRRTLEVRPRVSLVPTARRPTCTRSLRRTRRRGGRTGHETEAALLVLLARPLGAAEIATLIVQVNTA